MTHTPESARSHVAHALHILEVDTADAPHLAIAAARHRLRLALAQLDAQQRALIVADTAHADLCEILEWDTDATRADVVEEVRRRLAPVSNQHAPGCMAWQAWDEPDACDCAGRLLPDPEAPLPSVEAFDTSAVIRQFESDTLRSYGITARGRDELAGGARDDSRMNTTSREIL